MSEISFELNLVMPVFNGGDLLLGAIQSIEELNINFHNIFISFNGESDEDFHLFSSLHSQNLLKKNYQVFRTNKNLDALEHGIFFFNQLEKYAISHSILLFLAHDDRIIIPDANEFLNIVSLSSPRSTVFFPSYHLCKAGNYLHPKIIISRNRKMTSQEFFLKSLNENISTNMSGMVIPYLSYCEAVLSQQLAKAAGARFEHLTCIAKNTKNVIFHDKLYALIGQRDNSDGMALTIRQHRKASLNYMIQFLKNNKINNLHVTIVWIKHVIRKSVAYVLTML